MPVALVMIKVKALIGPTCHHKLHLWNVNWTNSWRVTNEIETNIKINTRITLRTDRYGKKNQAMLLTSTSKVVHLTISCFREDHNKKLLYFSSSCFLIRFSKISQKHDKFQAKDTRSQWMKPMWTINIRSQIWYQRVCNCNIYCKMVIK